MSGLPITKNQVQSTVIFISSHHKAQIRCAAHTQVQPCLPQRDTFPKVQGTLQRSLRRSPLDLRTFGESFGSARLACPAETFGQDRPAERFCGKQAHRQSLQHYFKRTPLPKVAVKTALPFSKLTPVAGSLVISRDPSISA